MKIPPQELDPFILKGIHLLRNSNLPVPNLRKVPIETKVEDKVKTLIQKFSHLPGEKYILTGSFKYNPNLKFPIPLQFKLISRSNQTAYPHPTQGLGLPLCDALIPPLGGYPERTPNFSLIIQQKVIFARLLLPGRKLNSIAKEQYAARQRVFAENREAILEAHKHLMGHFVEEELLDLFYFNLSKAEDPYQTLTKTLKLYSDLFLKKLKPNEDPTTMQNEGRERLKSKLALPQTPLKRVLFEFVMALDRSLTTDLTALVVSKKLTEKQKRLQIISLKQLTTFLKELEKKPPITLLTFLTPIEEDCQILTKGIGDNWTALSDELNTSLID